MKRHTFVPAFALLVLMAVPAFSQPTRLFDELFRTDGVGLATAAWLVESAVSPEGFVDSRDALDRLLGRPGLEAYKETAGNARLTRAEFAHIVQVAFNIPRGMFASLIPGPRYALRDLRYLGLVGKSGDPEDLISGPEALDIINRVIENGYRGRTE